MLTTTLFMVKNSGSLQSQKRKSCSQPELEPRKKRKLDGGSKVTKQTTRKPSKNTVPLLLTKSEVEILCSLVPNLPWSTTRQITLQNNRIFYKKFFRGLAHNESRNNYNKAVYEAIGVDKCLGNLDA